MNRDMDKEIAEYIAQQEHDDNLLRHVVCDIIFSAIVVTVLIFAMHAWGI